jgi:predicted glycosyltransferase
LPTLLFYCRVQFGAGHWVRSAALLAGLARRFRVVLAFRGRLTADLTVPRGVTLVKLPARLSEGDSSLALLLRRERPDAFVLESFPFGRLESSFELISALEEARSGPSPCPFVVSSVRDVQDCRRYRTDVHEAQVCTMIDRYFDAVLVHSDPRYFPLGSTFRRVNDLRADVVHTGYVVRADETPRWSPAAHEPRIVVSAGGGRGGEDLLRAAVEAQRTEGLADEFSMRVVAGTLILQDTWDELRLAAAGVPRLELIRWIDDLPCELARAAVSVSRCGYNTALDLIRTAVPALVVPYATPYDDEQSIRAATLAKLGAVRWLRPSLLDPQTLAEEIRRTARFRPRPLVLDLNGVDRSVEIVDEGVRRRNLPAPRA